jgi:hypothetical protein
LWDPIGTWQHGLIEGGTRLVDKKKQSFTFGTLFCGLDFWETPGKVASIFSALIKLIKVRQIAQEPTQVTSEWEAYSEVIDGGGCGHPAPEAKLRYEWMEHLMHKNMGIVRPDRVLVFGTMEDYVTIGHKLCENSSQLEAMTPLPG